jgi:hypothetical protein
MESGEMAQRALESAQKANARIDGHETLCADRYGGIISRMGRVEYLIYAVIALLLFGEGTIGDTVKRLFGVG